MTVRDRRLDDHEQRIAALEAASGVEEREDEPDDTKAIGAWLLSEMGHASWRDAWRHAADYRDEAVRHLRAVVAEIDPMEAESMTALLEAGAFLRRVGAAPLSESDDKNGCVHEWRSSFGDTFCVKCRADAPLSVEGDET